MHKRSGSYQQLQRAKLSAASDETRSGKPLQLPVGYLQYYGLNKQGSPDEQHAVASQGVAGPAGSLPHLERIQHAFGHHDVTSIKAHVGGPATQATQMLGAQAYASGNDVAFRGDPDLHTAAHEAAHVVQQRTGVHLKGGIGQEGDVYERHADSVADAVVRGESAAPLLDQMAGGAAAKREGSVQRSVLQRAPGQDGGGGNDGLATPMTGSQHSTPTLGMGTQVGAQGQTTGAPAGSAPAATHEELYVNLVATAATKLRQQPGQVPAEDALYQRRSDHGGAHVRHRQGSLAAPWVGTDMVPDSLFIGGAPSAADVRQGGIGDCYFMAVLLGIVNGDPGKISSMMRLAGGQVTTTFHRLNTATGKWQPVDITNANTLQTQPGAAGTQRLTGADFRIADTPQECLWWADITGGDTLAVHREDHFEVALWGPLMEMSYADFAQQYGKYGQGVTPAEQAQGGGYNILDSGGGSQDCYNMFYGDAVTSTGTEGVNATPGKNIVTTNIPAVQRLLEFEANKDHPGPAGGAQRFMQARVSPVGAAQRCQALVQSVNTQITLDTALDSISYSVQDLLNPPTPEETARRAQRTVDLQLLRTALIPLQAALTTFIGSASSANSQALAVAARPVQQPDVHRLLWDEGSPPPYRQLRESLGIVINLGTDNGPGRRTIYAAHAYNIQGVTLRGQTGQALRMTSAEVPARAAEIDAQRSTVIVQNPHASNEPDERGTGPADGVNEGRFTMNLDAFFRSYDLLRLASVEHKPQLGDFPTPDPSGSGTAMA